MNIGDATVDLLEAVSRFQLAVRRPWTPPPPSPRAWDPDDGSPPFEVSFRSMARSRSPSPVGPEPSVCAPADAEATVLRTPQRWALCGGEGVIVRRRRGYREAYPSPVSRPPPIVVAPVRTGAPNPKYERVGEYLILRN